MLLEIVLPQTNPARPRTITITHQASPYFPLRSSGLNLSPEKQNRQDIVVLVVVLAVVFQAVEKGVVAVAGCCTNCVWGVQP